MNRPQKVLIIKAAMTVVTVVISLCLLVWLLQKFGIIVILGVCAVFALYLFARIIHIGVQVFLEWWRDKWWEAGSDE